MIINVVFFKDPTSVVIEIDPNLFPTVNPVLSQNGLTASCYPNPCQSIRMNLIPFHKTAPTVML